MSVERQAECCMWKRGASTPWRCFMVELPHYKPLYSALAEAALDVAQAFEDGDEITMTGHAGVYRWRIARGRYAKTATIVTAPRPAFQVGGLAGYLGRRCG